MASLDYARSYLGTMTPSEVDRGLEAISGFISKLDRLHPGLEVVRAYSSEVPDSTLPRKASSEEDGARTANRHR